MTSIQVNARIHLRTRLLYGDEIAMGPGKAALLESIAEKGSISAAAKHMTMSYRRAWLLVDTMNRCFASPLVISAAGGKQGGGAHLSTLGIDVLKDYRAMETEMMKLSANHLKNLKKYLSTQV
jgi:molybdate transport system regulatory protein